MFGGIFLVAAVFHRYCLYVWCWYQVPWHEGELLQRVGKIFVKFCSAEESCSS